MTTPRWMTLEDEPDVRRLFAACHPGALARPKHWYQAVPTLVLGGPRHVMGFTSFTLSPTDKGFACYGQDVCVDTAVRGAGYGRLLHLARCGIAKSLGAVDFIGLTAPDNRAMIRIFEGQGLKPWKTIPNAYPHETPGTGVVWIGAL